MWPWYGNLIFLSSQKLSSERPSSDGEGVAENGIAMCNGKEQGEFCSCQKYINQKKKSNSKTETTSRSVNPHYVKMSSVISLCKCHRPGYTDRTQRAPFGCTVSPGLHSNAAKPWSRLSPFVWVCSLHELIVFYFFCGVGRWALCFLAYGFLVPI